MARQRSRSRIRRPRRKGDWFAALTNTAYTNVGAGVQTNINILTAFDEPVTVVRIVGRVDIIGTSEVSLLAHWAIWVNLPGDSGLDPDLSSDLTRGDIMMKKTINITSYAVGSYMPNNFETGGACDIKVKRKLNPESHIVLSMVAPVAYSYFSNLRAYVLLA